MKQILITTVFSLVILANASAQSQYRSPFNKVWMFGHKAGLDFSSGSPTPITSGLNVNAETEGCANVCDSAGHLLFYTNGSKVYNRNDVVMPNGNAIVSFSTFSSTQAALIVPVIGNANKYYVFSLQQAVTMGDDASCHLVYCMVDMTLDGGLGDVVVSTLRTPVADTLGEKMIAITGNSHNIWLIAHKRDTALFVAYEITSGGISATPVVSAAGRFSSANGYLVGSIKASPNRSKIVSNSFNLYFPASYVQKFGTELYDFDPSTGIVSNCIVLDSTESHYSAEFSPDNTKLYTDEQVAIDTVSIVQYDISLASPDLMRSSKTQIARMSGIDASDMKLGPDGKIYFVSDTFLTPLYSPYLNCISSPNLAGASCGFVYRAITMVSGTGMQIGLPNLYVTEDTGDISVAVSNLKVADGVTIFPNPARDRVSIFAHSAIGKYNILNARDKVVYEAQEAGSTATADISHLPPGMYWVYAEGRAMGEFLKE